MNILHLKYAVEIAKTGSLNKAAENLYMGQPNLSRAIKELEANLGITIFERSPKGMVATPEGEEFLQYAVKILNQIDEVESMYRDGKRRKQTFSLSAPRADYIAAAFAEFSEAAEQSGAFEFYYKETNALRTIKNVLDSEYKLGIIRYAQSYEGYFKVMLEEKGIACEPIAEFDSVLLMSAAHPLADVPEITRDALAPYTEIAHADPFVPTLPLASVLKDELPDGADKRIFVFERASRFALLCGSQTRYAWSSPVPQTELDRYGLVERRCADYSRCYRDVLIHRKEYRPDDTDRAFLAALRAARDKYMKQP